MENALQVLFLGGLGGAIGYGIAQAVKKRSEGGEKSPPDRGGARNTNTGRWSTGPGLETEVFARLAALERAFQEQTDEITARFNRLAARSRRRDPAGADGENDAPAPGLTGKQAIRARARALQ